MTAKLPTLVLTLLLVSAAARATPRASGGQASKWQAGQTELNRGNFKGALRILDSAAMETSEPEAQARVQLLRAQCLGAMQSYAKAEEALAFALEANPLATLDANRVDPALVKLLEGLRERLHGELTVTTEPPGALVTLDGRALGAAPLKTAANVGKHHLEARTRDNAKAGALELVVGPRRNESPVIVVQPVPVTPTSAAPLSSGSAPAPSLQSMMKPFADLRAVWEPLYLLGGLGFEVGGGLEVPYIRVSLHARLYPQFGVTARGAVTVPIVDRVNGYVSVEIPVLFEQSVAVGLGAAAGAEYRVSPWLSPFVELGIRHFFTGPGDDNRFALEVGARLRVP